MVKTLRNYTNCVIFKDTHYCVKHSPKQVPQKLHLTFHLVWGWVDNDWMFVFVLGWTAPLKVCHQTLQWDTILNALKLRDKLKLHLYMLQIHRVGSYNLKDIGVGRRELLVHWWVIHAPAHRRQRSSGVACVTAVSLTTSTTEMKEGFCFRR